MPDPARRLRPPRDARTFDSHQGVDSPGPACVVCGGPREARKREACSDRCRAALARRRRAEQRQARDRALVALLDQVEALHQRVAELLQVARRRLAGT
jgi:predicted nucleic acid-binding Zn ribbon protein